MDVNHVYLKVSRTLVKKNNPEDQSKFYFQLKDILYNLFFQEEK